MLNGIRSPLDGFASPFGPQRVPSFVPPGYDTWYDYAGDQYWRGSIIPQSSAITSARNSIALDLQADGSYKQTAANLPSITTLGVWGWQGFTNLVARLNPTVAQLPSTGGLTDSAGFAGFGNSVRFAGGVSRWGYQTPTIANGVAFAAAFLIYMEDGNPPAFGSGTVTSELNTFAIVVNGSTGGIVPTNFVTRDLGGGVYRVSVTGTTPSSGSNFGIVQYDTNQNRAFRVCSYVLVTGSVVPPPIPGSSDTGGPTRAAENLTLPNFSTIEAGQKIRYGARFYSTPGSKAVIGYHGADANNYIEVYANGTACHARVVAAGAETANIAALATGTELITTPGTNFGSWTHTGTTVTAPGSSGADRVEFNLSAATVAGRTYRVEIPNTMPGSGFFVDFGTGTGSQVGNLDSGTKVVYLKPTAPSSVIRIGRWSGSPTGTIGPISVKEVAALPVDGTVANIELTINAGSISLSVDGGTPASSGAVTMPTLSSLTTHKICSDATPGNWQNGALAYIGISN